MPGARIYPSLSFAVLLWLIASVPPFVQADSRWAAVGEYWRANPSTDNSRVNFRGTTQDDQIVFRGGCGPRPGFRASLHGYEGDALRRFDDQSERVNFVIVGRDGVSEAFTGRMHYFAPEAAWVMTDPLYVDFLESFASGERFQIHSAAGQVVAEFRLGGAREAFELMRSVCRLGE